MLTRLTRIRYRFLQWSLRLANLCLTSGATAVVIPANSLQEYVEAREFRKKFRKECEAAWSNGEPLDYGNRDLYVLLGRSLGIVKMKGSPEPEDLETIEFPEGTNRHLSIEEESD